MVGRTHRRTKKTTDLSELAGLLNGFSIQACPRLREALVKHLSTFQAPPPEVLHLRDCLRLDHHLIICWATFPRTRYHLQDFLPVCIFGGGPHGRVLSKVCHPAGKAKVNHVPLDQILVPLRKVRHHRDVFKIKDPPNPSRVDAIAIRRNFRHVHRCDGEVTKVLLELEIKENHIGVKQKSTCEPFSNFSQLSS